MAPLDKYRIAFQGMRAGTHNFIYSVDDTFFAEFDNSPVSQAKVLVDLIFEKQEMIFDLRFHLRGSVEVECDRCLEPYQQAIDSTYEVFVKFEGRPEQTSMNDEDVVYINRNDSFLDVSQLIYEFAILSLPSRKVDHEGCLFSGTNPDREETENEETDSEIDPRWASLIEIKKSKDGTSETENFEDEKG